MKQHLPSPGAFALAALLTCNFASQGQHIAGSICRSALTGIRCRSTIPTAPQILKRFFRLVNRPDNPLRSY